METVSKTSGKVLIGFIVVSQAGKEIKVEEGMIKVALMQFFLQQSPDSFWLKGELTRDPWHLRREFFSCLRQSFLQQSFACAGETVGDMGINKEKAKIPNASFLNILCFMV